MTKGEVTRLVNLTRKRRDKKLTPVDLKHLKRLSEKKRAEAKMGSPT
jgi:hypothetical protein